MDRRHHLYLTRMIPLPSDAIDTFAPLMSEATDLWNLCVQRHSDSIEIPGTQLPRQSAEAVLGEYREACRSFTRHRSHGHTEIHPPGRKPTGTLRTLTFRREDIFMAMGDLLNIRLKESIYVARGYRDWSTITLPSHVRIEGNLAEVKIRITDAGGLELHATFDFGEISVESGAAVAAYDLNASCIARTSSYGTQHLIVLRELRSILQYRERFIGDIQSKIERCQPGSRRYHQLQRVKLDFLTRNKRRVRQMIHAATSLMAEIDVREQISTSIVGYLSGMRRHSVRGRRTTKVNQNIHHIPYDVMTRQHAYKTLLRQIHPETTSERFSSQVCAVCGAHDASFRITRGTFCCGVCHTISHADLNGSANILKNHLFGTCVDVPMPVSLQPPIVYHWSQTRNRYVQVSP